MFPYVVEKRSSSDISAPQPRFSEARTRLTTFKDAIEESQQNCKQQNYLNRPIQTNKLNGIV